MRILVVGASGKMGAKIVRELRARGADVRALVRTARAIEGAEVVVGDLGDPAACEGVGVIVSALQGLEDVIVDGQTRLLRAAEAAGVARMIPSDYSLDLFKTIEGGNRNLDLRRRFDRVLDDSRVRGTSVLCGAFLDTVVQARKPGPDGVMKVWGDPDQPYDMTATDDVARYTAAVALDDAAPRVVRVAGDTLSSRELAAAFGPSVRVERAGSIEDLGALIDRMRAADPAPGNTFPPWQQLQYVRDMASGAGKLDPLDNARYPDIHPITVREFLARWK